MTEKGADLSVAGLEDLDALAQEITEQQRLLEQPNPDLPARRRDVDQLYEKLQSIHDEGGDERGHQRQRDEFARLVDIDDKILGMQSDRDPYGTDDSERSGTYEESYGGSIADTDEGEGRHPGEQQSLVDSNASDEMDRWSWHPLWPSCLQCGNGGHEES